jgi:hypothetical protein
VIDLGQFLSDRLLGLKRLVYIIDDEREKLSIIKLFLLFGFIVSRILVFIYFTTLPISVITACKNAIADPIDDPNGMSQSDKCRMIVTEDFFESNGFIIQVAFAFMALLLIMVLVTWIGNGWIMTPSEIDKKIQSGVLTLQRAQNLKESTKKKIKSTSYFFFVLTLILLAFFMINGAGRFALIMSGGSYYLWYLFLEPFLYFSAILVIMEIIFAHSHIEGYKGKNGLFLILVLVFFSFLSYSFGFLIPTVVVEDTRDPRMIPGLAVIVLLVSTSFVIISALTLIGIWFLKDRKYGKDSLREKKKAALPIILLFTFLFVVIKVLPSLFVFEGTLRQITDIIDIGTIFIALILAIWRVTFIPEAVIEPTVGWRRYNIFDKIPPYTKVLIVFFIALSTFFVSLQESTISALTGETNSVKPFKLAALIFYIEYIIFYVMWRFKPVLGSTEPGLI